MFYNHKIKFACIFLLGTLYISALYFSWIIKQDNLVFNPLYQTFAHNLTEYSVNHSQETQESGNSSFVNSSTFPNGMNKFEQGAHPNITSGWCTANLSKRPHDGVCSYKLFQTYFSVCGKFPDLGKWTGISGKKFDHAKFSSPFCHVESVTGKPLQSHLIKTGVKRILIVGDSHGVRYFKALRQMVNESGYDCQSILEEQGTQKGNRSMRHYISTVWGIPEVALKMNSRGCCSCTSTLLKCSPIGQGRIIELEFLGMVLSSNFTVPNNAFCLQHTSNKTYHNLCSAKTEKELIFKHYLQNRKPDIVIISTTASHDFKSKKKKVRNTVAKVIPYYKELKSLLAALEPQATMWLTTINQRHAKGMNKSIMDFNKALFGLLKKDLTSAVKSQLTTAAFDNLAITVPISHIKWSRDSIHFHPVYYTEAMRHLMNIWISARV